MVSKIIMTKEKTTLAGVWLMTPFAMLAPLMPHSKVEIIRSCVFDFSELVAIVETRGRCEKVVGNGAARKNGEEPWP